MSSSIVITSIFSPTEAVSSFAQKDGYKLIVVGDKKTPAGWEHENVKFLPVSDQQGKEFELAELLPYNHYCRKMLGYLYAIKNNARVIIDTDDDNIPKENWDFPETNGSYRCLADNLGFVNIYKLYTDAKIWPRGLPLHYINTSDDILQCSSFEKKEVKVGIWQGLADDDPDVDAIYRLTDNKPCFFNNSGEYVLGKGTISPFNSQNTLIVKELFPLLYLPTYVTFRFTDILRGLIAQPIMWLDNYLLGFCNPTVIQKRNPHDYVKDFESEIPMYLHSHNIIDLITGVISSRQSMADNLHKAYSKLLDNKIVVADEIKTLEAWLKDLDNLKKNEL